MQYSKDGVSWTFSSNAKFDADRIAKSLGLKPGDFIYCREKEGDTINPLQWGRSNEKPKRQF